MASFTGGPQRFDEIELQRELKRLKTKSLKSALQHFTSERSEQEQPNRPEEWRALEESGAKGTPVTTIEDIHEEQWQKDLLSLVFTKKKITTERMRQVANKLSETTPIQILSFEGCDFEEKSCEILVSLSPRAEKLHIEFLDLMESRIAGDEDWESIGQCVNKYNIRGLRLCECQLNSWTFRAFCSGMVNYPIAPNTMLAGGIIDFRENDILFDDDTLFSLEDLISSRRFNIYCFDSFTVKINQHQKVLLDMKPDMQGINSSVWGKIVPLCGVHGILLSSSHDLASDPNSFAKILKDNDYNRLKELSIQIDEGSPDHYMRAVTLTTMLGIEDFIITDDGNTLHESCLNLVLKHLYEHGHKLRSFGILFDNEMSRQCLSVIGDILCRSKVKRFLVSGKGEFDIIWPLITTLIEKCYLLQQLILKFGAEEMPSADELSLSSDDDIFGDDSETADPDVVAAMLILTQVVSEEVVFELPKKLANQALPLLKKNLEGSKRLGVKTVDEGISIYTIKPAVLRQSPQDWLQQTVCTIQTNVGNVGRMDLSEKILNEKDVDGMTGILRFCDELILTKCQLNDQLVSKITEALSVAKHKIFLIDLSGNPGIGEIAARSISTLLQKRNVKNIKAIGCGLEKFHDDIIAPAMLEIPQNVGTTITYAEDQVTALVDRQGLTIEFISKDCTIEIPANAVQEPIELTFKLVHPKRSDNLPKDTYPITSILKCFPDEVKFNEFIKVTLHTWVKVKSSSSNRKLKLKLLTKQCGHERWNKESEMEHGDDDFIEFQINHFSDYNVVVDANQAAHLQANYCNMLFCFSSDPLTKQNHILVSKIVPNNEVAKQQARKESQEIGMSLYPAGLNRLTIVPGDQISVFITTQDEQEPQQVNIRHSKPTQYTGSTILENLSSPNVKFTVRLLNRSDPNIEKLVDLEHNVAGATWGEFNDPVILRWRPESENPERHQHTVVNNISIRSNSVTFNQENRVIQSTVGPADAAQETGEEEESGANTDNPILPDDPNLPILPSAFDF